MSLISLLLDIQLLFYEMCNSSLEQTQPVRVYTIILITWSYNLFYHTKKLFIYPYVITVYLFIFLETGKQEIVKEDLLM